MPNITIDVLERVGLGATGFELRREHLDDRRAIEPNAGTWFARRGVVVDVDATFADLVGDLY